ncbi:MAG: amino acid permease [Acidimicrobiia bacterium]
MQTASRVEADAGEAGAPRARAIPAVPEPATFRLKRKLLGPPLHTDQLVHERLGKPTALAVFASDCMSSSAYATEEILRVLVPAVGLMAFSLVVPVTVAMLVVLFFLILSYRQTIKEYPSAGGAYIVTKDNFGILPAQVAGVALLTDYILTVAVSTAAGTAALVSAFPALDGLRVPICLGFILVIAFGNLRGVKESGAIFAVPTYFFLAVMALMLVAGAVRYFTTGLPSFDGGEGVLTSGGSLLTGFALVYVVLHAFASGGAAVTGVEAISNGVPAFKPPEWKNARTTLMIMGACLGTLFLGLSWLASQMHVEPYAEGTPTVIASVGKLVFGESPLGHVMFFALQAGTMLILVLAANTSYADFPRLASFHAGDYFMPKQLTKRGHRLVYSNGILFLSVTAGILVLVTGAVVDRLIPLYAIGVFTSFTLSQAGMARHHWRKREKGWRGGIVINGIGAALCFVVLIIIGVTKFLHGAWLVIVLVPALVLLLTRLNRQYTGEIDVLEADAKAATEAPILAKHTVLVLVDDISRSTARAVQFARSMTPDEIRGLHVAVDVDDARELAREWSELSLSRMPLELVDCPDRRIDRAVLEVVLEETAEGDTEVSVLIPRREYSRLWHRLLHDRTSDNIARAIARVPHANATFVPFLFDEATAPSAPVSELPELATASPERAARGAKAAARAAARLSEGESPDPATPIRDVTWRSRVRVEGRVQSMRVRPLRQTPYLELTVEDDTGRLLVVFSGRRNISGVDVGTRMTVEGTVGVHRDHLAILNPVYSLHAAH